MRTQTGTDSSRRFRWKVGAWIAAGCGVGSAGVFSPVVEGP